MAVLIAVNAKAQRPSVCNALETLLVDAPVAPEFVPAVVGALRAAGVEVRGDERVQALAAGRSAAGAGADGADPGAAAGLGVAASGPDAAPAVIPATEADWGTEYLDYIINVRVVDGLDEALAHIQRYSTGLADAIVTANQERAQRFVAAVDSAAVLVNASTRLVDGGEFGLGAEIGISTDRIGPRGPMGVAELTSLKWVVMGSGQVRQ
jgi:glutamate-5-semialdehyde dehydrogenase